MTPEEQVIAAVKEAVEKKGYQDKAAVDAAISEALKSYKPDSAAKLSELENELKAVKDAAVKQGEEMEKLRKQDGRPETLKSVLTAEHENIKKALAEKSSARVFLKTAVLRSSIASDIPGMLLPDVGRMATARLRMAEICQNWPVGPDSHGVIGFWDQTTATRNADNKAENAIAPESAIAWTFVSKTIDKIFDSIPFTKEAAMDISWLMAEIENFINTNLAIKENSQILLGTGTSPQLYGLYTNATEFDFATFGNTIEKAQLYDLVRAMATTIQSGKDNNFRCNYAVMNDTDLLRMTSEKDADGNYINPPFVRVNPDGTVSVDGILCIPQSDLTPGTMLVGDFTKARRYNMDGVELEIGYNGNDIVYDRQTLIGRIRESIVVRNVDTGAFLKCSNITNAIAGISVLEN
jgi:HK97 family phage major capsid protein